VIESKIDYEIDAVQSIDWTGSHVFELAVSSAR